jgi:hypothetical protein
LLKSTDNGQLSARPALQHARAFLSSVKLALR